MGRQRLGGGWHPQASSRPTVGQNTSTMMVILVIIMMTSIKRRVVVKGLFVVAHVIVVHGAYHFKEYNYHRQCRFV